MFCICRDASVSAFTNFSTSSGDNAWGLRLVHFNGFTFGAQASDNGYDVEFYTNAMSGINGLMESRAIGTFNGNR